MSSKEKPGTDGVNCNRFRVSHAKTTILITLCIMGGAAVASSLIFLAAGYSTNKAWILVACYSLLTITIIVASREDGSTNQCRHSCVSITFKYVAYAAIAASMVLLALFTLAGYAAWMAMIALDLFAMACALTGRELCS